MSPLPKKAYKPPRLIRYGDVRVLTQTGSGAVMETGTMQGMKMPSSRALKENIARIGTHPLGIGLYLFDYKPEFRELYGNGRRFGVLAEEVAAVLPQAVSLNALGHTIVDYAMLGVRPAGR